MTPTVVKHSLGVCHEAETHAPAKVLRAGEYSQSPLPVLGASNPGMASWRPTGSISMLAGFVWHLTVFKRAVAITIQTHLHTAGATPHHLSISVLSSLMQDSRSWEGASTWLTLGSAPMPGLPRAGSAGIPQWEWDSHPWVTLYDCATRD